MRDSTVCYTISNDFVSSSNQYVPCGGSSSGVAQSCCNVGDYCLEDGICRYTHRGVVNGTGYYMAGCTDSSWSNPACPKQCASEYSSDIIYDMAASNWKCCDSAKGHLNCQQPSDLVVSAPAPSDLSTILQLSTSAPPFIATTAIGAVTISHSAIPTPNLKAAATSSSIPTSMSASTPLSTGAKAGIGIGVIIGFALLFGGGYLFYQRNKRRHERFQPFAETSESLHSKSGITLTTTTQSNSGSGTDTRRQTFASRTTAAVTGSYNTNRSTYASSYWTSNPASPTRNTTSTIPPLPEGADGIQVVKQLPSTPGPEVGGMLSEKIAVEEEEEKYAGPYEMNDEEYELHARRQNMSELEGTVVARAELDAVSRRSVSSAGQEEMVGVEGERTVSRDEGEVLPGTRYGDSSEEGDK
ncbi:uncharacterized protein LTR77_009994 [Saxophila tyrrhenica]|uniref:Uncharacterized protein n=1 Tax=Saxophila tyrrhenica TaxID=1690608 RepID=A0AAV9NYD0_9PEZI|nr:hypothetical protein LTR77_009994 [Saxophila tyrrhenica]